MHTHQSLLCTISTKRSVLRPTDLKHFADYWYRNMECQTFDIIDVNNNTNIWKKQPLTVSDTTWFNFIRTFQKVF